MAIDVKELMKQIGRIRVYTNRLVNEHLSGEYHSVFKGQGIEFDEVREYTPGDEVRSIDWNVTARMGHPFVKRFAEERELSVIFLIDISGSQSFGSKTRSKAETAAELTCLLALSAIKNQDKVGLILFSDKIDKIIPPRKGRKAAIRLVREVLACEETRRGTNIAEALRFLSKVQKKRSVVFLISDFMDDDYFPELHVASKKHDIVCCHISDPREREIPSAGLIEVQDPETGALMLLDTSSQKIRKSFQSTALREHEALKTSFRKFGMDTLWLSTDRPYFDDVRRLFRMRQVRFGRG